MFEKRRKYSYTDQKNKQHWVRWILLIFFILYTAYTFLTAFIFSTHILESDTMQPNLRAGDRFICSSYTFYRLLPDISWLNASPPIHRGNVVLVDMSLRESRNFLETLLNGAIRFFTAQRVSFGNWGEQLYIKRVIGLPGDEITMTNYIFRVKPKGGSYTFTEFELWDKPYDVTVPESRALWDASIPFSGNIETFVLGDNECFVIADDRSNTNDSRTWGPVSLDFIVGKALFRYWPITRLSRP